MSINITEQDIANIANQYELGAKTADLAKQYGVCQHTIIRKIKAHGTKLRGTTKYNINENFLKDINSSAKAYFIGFFIADGCIYIPNGKNTWRFALSIVQKDSYILEEFCKLLNYNKPLVIRHRNKNWQPIAELIIHNQVVCNQLLNNNVLSQKTFKEKYPKIPSYLDRHFIRGLFDGDGHVSNKEFSIISSVSMCNSVKDILEKNNIYGNVKIDYNYSKPLGRFYIYNKKNIIKLRDFLYRDASLYLHRKKDIFDNVKYLERNKKLKTEQVIEIKKLLAQGNLTHDKIAKKYKVSRRNITNIKNNIIWKHVEV